MNELRECVDVMNKFMEIFPKKFDCPNYAEHGQDSPVWKAWEKIQKVLNSLLSCEGLPEEREHKYSCRHFGGYRCDCGADGFNEARSLCALAPAKKEIEWREKRPSEAEIDQVIRYFLIEKNITVNVTDKMMPKFIADLAHALYEKWGEKK